MAELEVITADITTLAVDAIVNAANRSLMGGAGVDGAIHRAGGPAILAECQRIVEARGPLDTGDAVATTAGELPADHVIHTVGPVFAAAGPDAPRLLRSCYVRALAVAADLGARSLAFPSISTGVYGYPIEEAAAVAMAVLVPHTRTMQPPERVVMCCFSDHDRAAYEMARRAATA